MNSRSGLPKAARFSFHGPFYYLTQCLAKGHIQKFLLKTQAQRQRRGKVWQGQSKRSHWRWVVSSGLAQVGAKGIWQMGHGRWAIENKAFSLLTRTYHLSHCFHHHPLAIVARLLLTLLAVNVTALFYRHWIVPRAEADYTRSDLLDELREGLAGHAAWQPMADTG